jgi:PncC family amidohydrolase
MKSLVDLLSKCNLTLASCESLTSGLFAESLTKIAGAGQVFKGGLIVYSNEAKKRLGKVSSLTLKKYGAISEQCAQEMARNTQRILGVDLAISFTGNAGPSAQENKPVGLVFIGLVVKENLISKCYQFKDTREEVRRKTVEAGVELIKSNLITE